MALLKMQKKLYLLIITFIADTHHIFTVINMTDSPVPIKQIHSFHIVGQVPNPCICDFPTFQGREKTFLTHLFIVGAVNVYEIQI